MSSKRRQRSKIQSGSARQTRLKEIDEDELLLRESVKIVGALGKMFAPCCEVVLHDLRQPQNSIVAIECPLSGRKIGQPVTEMGLARVKDPSFPDVVQNYSNSFPDGRQVKSTSIGLRNTKGKFIAAICLNLDVSLFSSIQRMIEQLTRSNTTAAPVQETLRARSINDVREAIESFAVRYNMQPRSLNVQQRRELVSLLATAGLLQLRGAASITAKILGISRASVYNALKMNNL